MTNITDNQYRETGRAQGLNPDPAQEVQSRLKAVTLALEESVKLQSFYAGLLNQYDGGLRMTFVSGDAWIARLREVGKLPA